MISDLRDKFAAFLAEQCSAPARAPKKVLNLDTIQKVCRVLEFQAEAEGPSDGGKQGKQGESENPVPAPGKPATETKVKQEREVMPEGMSEEMFREEVNQFVNSMGEEILESHVADIKGHRLFSKYIKHLVLEEGLEEYRDAAYFGSKESEPTEDVLDWLGWLHEHHRDCLPTAPPMDTFLAERRLLRENTQKKPKLEVQAQTGSGMMMMLMLLTVESVLELNLLKLTVNIELTVKLKSSLSR